MVVELLLVVVVVVVAVRAKERIVHWLGRTQSGFGFVVVSCHAMVSQVRQ